MTPAQLEHLHLIDAHLERLLDIASKRTPGEYVKLGSYVSSKDNHHGVADCGYCDEAENEDNAAFIASCAGNAEAGWRATRAAIKSCLADDPRYQDMFYIANKELVDAILAAFPLELIQKP